MNARSPRLWWSVGALLAVLIALDVVLTVHAANESATRAAAATGTVEDRPLGSLALVDENGRHSSLAAYRGRYVVLAPMLTTCREVCPLTMAALAAVRSGADARGLGRRVAVLAVTVDPWRDKPSRLRAFRRRTGTPVPLLTGSHAELRRLWRAFGVGFSRVREGDSFDVAHSDGVFVVDPRGHLRFSIAGMPQLDAALPARLSRLLSAEGRRDLRDPRAPWHPDDVLDDLWHLMGLPSAPPAAPTPVQAARALAGSPRELAALHRQAGSLLSGDDFRARLAALRGRPVVVNEWASWCPPCREEASLFASAAARFGTRVAFLGLNVTDNAAAARKFLAAHRPAYPSYSDPRGAAARALGATAGLPVTAYLDARGRVSSVHVGQYSTWDDLARDIRRHAAVATRSAG